MNKVHKLLIAFTAASVLTSPIGFDKTSYDTDNSAPSSETTNIVVLNNDFATRYTPLPEKYAQSKARQNIDFQTGLSCMTTDFNTRCVPIGDVDDAFASAIFDAALKNEGQDISLENSSHYEQVTPFIIRRTSPDTDMVIDYDFGLSMLIINGQEQVPFKQLNEDGQEHVNDIKENHWKDRPQPSKEFTNFVDNFFGFGFD